MNISRKRAIWIAIPVLALALAAAGVRGWLLRKSDEDAVLRVSGNIEVTDAEVSFKLSGRVEARAVSEGEIVRSGDLVAELESTELAQEVALRRAELAAANATLAELEAGSRPEEIAQAEAALDLARAQERQEQADLRRKKGLAQQKVISTRDLDLARTAQQVAAARVREAEERLRLLRKGPRQETIDQARARVEQTREALHLAETRLAYATLSAPISGVVLSENLEPGEYAAAGMPVVTIGDLENVWLRAYVNETDLGRVRVGQVACLRTDTYPGKAYPGRLSFIASEAEFTPKSVQTSEERVKLVYRIKIDVPNPGMELKPGMPVDAEIYLGEGEAPCTPSAPKG